jgi:transposase
LGEDHEQDYDDRSGFGKKDVLHTVCCNQYGKQVSRKLLRRNQVLDFFAQKEPCLVGLESCGSAHYWAREIQKLGHHVKMIPPQYVKPYLRGNKNDYNDALAIAEAVARPEMRYAAINSQEQQDIQALHRLRERRIQERTALSPAKKTTYSRNHHNTNEGSWLARWPCVLSTPRAR